MIVRSGLPLTVNVLFDSGHPDADVNWALLDANADVLTTGTAAVASDAVSVGINISADMNTLSPVSLSGHRYLLWDYTVSGVIFTGEKQYEVEARPPFGASVDGVRAKLGGVEPKDLPDDQISLMGAYRGFRALAGSERIAEAAADEDKADLMRHAIEAAAALALIPTMAVRVALSEDSGTNSFKRQEIDWGVIADALSATVDQGILAVYPLYDPIAGAGAIFILATPATDAITGA